MRQFAAYERRAIILRSRRTAVSLIIFSQTAQHWEHRTLGRVTYNWQLHGNVLTCPNTMRCTVSVSLYSNLTFPITVYYSFLYKDDRKERKIIEQRNHVKRCICDANSDYTQNFNYFKTMTWREDVLHICCHVLSWDSVPHFTMRVKLFWSKTEKNLTILETKFVTILTIKLFFFLFLFFSDHGHSSCLIWSLIQEACWPVLLYTFLFFLYLYVCQFVNA